MTSLFEETPPPRRSIASLLLSCIGHGIGFTLFYYALMHTPVIRDAVISEHYFVHTLTLHEDAAQPQTAARAGIQSAYPGPPASPESAAESAPATEAAQAVPQAPKATAQAPQATGTGSAPTPPKPVIPRDVDGPQTLIQPEFRTHVAMTEETPIPTAVVWTPEIAPAKEVVPPPPDKPANSEARTSLDPPNEELDLSDLSINPSELASSMSPPAGSTSPLSIRSPETDTAHPATVTDPSQQPTSSAVLSISDMRMADGTIALPPVNETNSAKPGNMTPGQSAAAASNGNSLTSRDSGLAGGAGLASMAGGASQPASQGASAAQDAVEHITRPPDGKFGVIVVGSGGGDEYPETLRIWSGRMAYTAYLHVGLSKNWILQYAQLRSADAATDGNVDRIEAPWPYDIFRPNTISSDMNSDVMIIHGFLNQFGRFESLAVAFPANFARANFVLSALRQWQFRPARQNGKATAVEIVLIIPDQLD